MKKTPSKAIRSVFLIEERLRGQSETWEGKRHQGEPSGAPGKRENIDRYRISHLILIKKDKKRLPLDEIKKVFRSKLARSSLI